MKTIISDRHQHPIAIFRYSFRYLFLLSVPLLRGLRYIRTPQGFYHWIQGTWIDLTAISLLLILPFLFWRGYTYTLTDHGFILRRGIILRLETVIPRHSITTLSVEQPLLLRAMHAARLAVDTDAGNQLRADFTLTVSEHHAGEILAERQSADESIIDHYHANPMHIIVLSLLVSNSLSGMLILGTAFYQSGRILGDSYRQQLVGNLENVADYINSVPRTAAIILLLILLGWGIAAGRNLLRHLPFRAVRYQAVLSIRHGTFTKREYLCSVSSVHYLDYRQTILCKLLRLYIVFIHCIGYGKGRDSLSLLIPASPIRRAQKHARCLLPEFSPQSATIRPTRNALLRYVFYPLLGLVFTYPVTYRIALFLPMWQDVLLHLAVIAYIPLVWAAIVKIIDRFTAGIGYGNGFVTLYYSRRLTFHSVTIREEDVVCIEFRQSVFQRCRRRGDLVVFSYSEEPRRHRIRHLSELDIEQFLHKQ